MPKLDQNKFSRLHADAVDQDEEEQCNPIDVTIFHEGRLMTFQYYQVRVRMEANDAEDKEVEDYVKLLGPKAAQSVILLRR